MKAIVLLIIILVSLGVLLLYGFPQEENPIIRLPEETKPYELKRMPHADTPYPDPVKLRTLEHLEREVLRLEDRLERTDDPKEKDYLGFKISLFVAKALEVIR